MKLPGKKSRRQRNVIFIDRSAITFYSKAGQKPLLLELGSEIIKDMDVVAPELFIQALAYWMDNNKIAPCDVVIVLSENVYFEHAVQSLAKDDASDKEIEMYLSTVPFEQAVNRVLVDDASKRVVVINRDYYDLLLEFLEKRYFRVLALLPASLLKVKSPEEVNVEQIIKNLDDYKKFNFLSDFERKLASESFITGNAPKNTRNLKVMVGVFALLIVILGIVVYFSLIKKG